MVISVSGKVGLNSNINAEFQLGNSISSYRGVQYYKPSTSTLATFDTTNLNFSEFRGTQTKVSANVNITSDSQNLTINTGNVAGYVAGFSKLTITISNGVYVGSTSTGSYALTITDFVSGDDVYLVNNGVIIGAGGKGGDSHSNAAGDPGNAGGNALRLLCSTNIINNGTIAGGGGGGGAADGGRTNGGTCHQTASDYTGSGGGGGAGYTAGSGGSGDNSGSSGTRTTGGAGGTNQGQGGAGGSPGQAGQTSGNGRSGGAAGKYIVGSNYANFIVAGTRLGDIG